MESAKELFRGKKGSEGKKEKGPEKGSDSGMSDELPRVLSAANLRRHL